MTRFGEISPLTIVKNQAFINLFEGLFNIRQNFESTLAKNPWLLAMFSMF